MASNAVREIQQALKNKGFDPGAIDGIWGRRTIAAVQRSQRQQGLEADGIVGPKTSAALFPEAAVANDPLLPWFEEAKHLMGTKEALGDKNNPAIMDWAKNLDIHYAGEDDEAYQILGGNQSDEVCLMWLSKDRFRCARWPETAASLNSKIVQKERNEGLSVNEA